MRYMMKQIESANIQVPDWCLCNMRPENDLLSNKAKPKLDEIEPIYCSFVKKDESKPFYTKCEIFSEDLFTAGNLIQKCRKCSEISSWSVNSVFKEIMTQSELDVKIIKEKQKDKKRKK